MHALVGDVCHLPPRAVGALATAEDLPLTSIPLLHPVHHPPTVGRAGQVVLRDALVGQAASEVNEVRRFPQPPRPRLLPKPYLGSPAVAPEPSTVATQVHPSAH